MADVLDVILDKLRTVEGKVDELRKDFHERDKLSAVFEARVYAFAAMIAILANELWGWAKSVFF